MNPELHQHQWSCSAFISCLTEKTQGFALLFFLQTEETPGGQSKALIALGFFISTCFTMLCSCHGIPALGQLHVTEEQGISFLFCRGNFHPFPQANKPEKRLER